MKVGDYLILIRHYFKIVRHYDSRKKMKKVIKFVKLVLFATVVYNLLNFLINRIKSSKSKSRIYYDEELQFGISIGEYCKICEEEIPLNQGGFTGKPTLCVKCKISETRHNKLNELEI
jgi:hypothetical protein